MSRTQSTDRDRYPWILVGLLWLVAFLNSADRNILIAVLPQLKIEFGLTNSQLALLGSVFFWIYAVGAFVAGRIGDSVRRTRVILYGLIFWSCATGGSALATGFGLLLAMRGLVAIGESAYYPTATALIGDWHRPAMRSRALSIHQTAVFAGAGLGAVATGYIAQRLSYDTSDQVGIPTCGERHDQLDGFVGIALCVSSRAQAQHEARDPRHSS